jgi:hypothetical protein
MKEWPRDRVFGANQLARAPKVSQPLTLGYSYPFQLMGLSRATWVNVTNGT